MLAKGFVMFVGCPVNLGDFFLADKAAAALGTEPVHVNKQMFSLGRA
jgi:hypothetical protein